MRASLVSLRAAIVRSIAALAIASIAVTFVAPSGAGPEPVSATPCGLSFGTPQVEGAAGSLDFVVPTIPAVTGRTTRGSGWSAPDGSVFSLGLAQFQRSQLRRSRLTVSRPVGGILSRSPCGDRGWPSI